MRKSDRAFCNTVGLRPAFRLGELDGATSCRPVTSTRQRTAQSRKRVPKKGTGPIFGHVAQARQRFSVIVEWAGKGDWAGQGDRPRCRAGKSWKRGHTPLQGWKGGTGHVDGVEKRGQSRLCGRKVEGWGQVRFLGTAVRKQSEKGERPPCEVRRVK
jgi:hypothetical protein